MSILNNGEYMPFYESRRQMEGTCVAMLKVRKDVPSRRWAAVGCPNRTVVEMFIEFFAVCVCLAIEPC